LADMVALLNQAGYKR